MKPRYLVSDHAKENKWQLECAVIWMLIEIVYEETTYLEYVLVQDIELWKYELIDLTLMPYFDKYYDEFLALTWLVWLNLESKTICNWQQSSCE